MADDHEDKQAGLVGKITVSFQENVAIITMDCGQNRCNKLFVERMNKALDEVLEYFIYLFIYLLSFI